MIWLLGDKAGEAGPRVKDLMVRVRDTRLPRGRLLQGPNLVGTRKELSQGLGGGLAKSGLSLGLDLFGSLAPFSLPNSWLRLGGRGWGVEGHATAVS